METISVGALSVPVKAMGAVTAGAVGRRPSNETNVWC